MAKSCPYCAQSGTHKDKFGYCKKYSCFSVSGDKEKYEEFKRELSNTIFLPTYKRNSFDGSPRNPQQEEKRWIYLKIQNLLGFVPLEVV